MLRLFLRLYLLLMLPATAAFVFFMYATDQVMAQLHAEQQRARAGVAFDRAERIVTDQRVPDWQGRLKEIEATFRVAHEVVPIDKALGDFFMSGSEKERLRTGAIAFRDRPGGGTVYLRRIKESDRALRIEWVGAYEYLALYYTIIVALVTTAVAAILWFWTRPLWRDLEALKAATARVGAGDLRVRAEVPKSSMLAPIATGFNAMAQRVQLLLQSHRDLEQGVAHELRTPLAQLKFDLELARTASADAEREERFVAMERDVVDLEDLVSELLVLASLREAPPYVPRDVRASDLVDEVLRRAHDEMRAAGRAIAIEPPRHLPESLSCDSKYLSRALANVLRNAVRYAKSRVAMTIERAGTRTTISVDDDGPGVPPLERDRLFEPFTRLEGSRGRDSGGVGLGLAIVKSVAEWHGGEARISDSPLGGARVSISW
ncbi:MAG: ATP-binding protein [Pseudomonadota bacterium]|nr:ATP-binding protein [Pseudomonadota bacterium]